MNIAKIGTRINLIGLNLEFPPKPQYSKVDFAKIERMIYNKFQVDRLKLKRTVKMAGLSEDKSDYWIQIAEYDLETARAMHKTGRLLYVGFMCHQVAEKSLKAVMAKSGAMPPKVHALVRLAELGGLVDLLSYEQKELLNELSPLNIEARYPSHRDQLAASLNEQYCIDLVTRTEGFLSWIKQQL